MRRWNHGLVLGKFMPLHLGHCHLIDQARSRVDRLTVLVCSLENEPIPGDLRTEWVRATYPDLDIVHVQEEVPSYPHESPDFAAIWTDLIRRHAGLPDVFFASEDYAADVGSWLHCDHVIIDKHRSAVPISGTDVRKSPHVAWKFLPDVVKPYFTVRIAIVGPESTGKSTLARLLAADLGAVHVPEFGREAFPWLDPEFVFLPRHIDEIAAGQHHDVMTAVRSGPRFVVSDTEAICTSIWSEMYFGATRPAVEDFIRRQYFDLYLVCDTDLPWVDDGTRYHEPQRAWFAQRLAARLSEHGVTQRIVSGAGDRRLQAALDHVRSFVEVFRPEGARGLRSV